jgi:hypothetical protein
MAGGAGKRAKNVAGENAILIRRERAGSLTARCQSAIILSARFRAIQSSELCSQFLDGFHCFERTHESAVYLVLSDTQQI